MGFYEDLIHGIKSSVEAQFDDKPSRLAKAAGTHPSTLARLMSGDRQKWLQLISRIADSAGLRIVHGGCADARDVCFVNAHVVSSADVASPIVPEDYLAVPLVSEAGAGPGIIPIDEYESWFLVYRNEPSIRMRSNLIAVRIANGSTSMEPTLHPGDIVLVDRDDKIIARPGGIWLVMEPDGSGKIKRVKIDGVKARRVTRVTFYSDNVAENPPEIYSLEEDYGGDWNRVIVGRVVWAWSDLSKK